MYLHQHTDWTSFTWDNSVVLPLAARVRFAQGFLLGALSDVGFAIESEVELDAVTNEVVASSKIEGVVLDADKVRSSVSQQLGLAVPDATLDTRDVDGAVSIIVDATRNFDSPLSRERLCGWHNALFPQGYSGLYKIRAAQYRDREMNVVSGPIEHERVHFSAPQPDRVEPLMDEFLAWFNTSDDIEPLVKAGLAHLWFLTIHPFDDGNGRIARALTELLLSRSDQSPRRFYSMASYIESHREAYYHAIEQSQKGTPDVTEWLVWFLKALEASLRRSEETLRDVLDRAAFWKTLGGVSLNDRQRAVLGRLKGGFEGKLTASKWAKLCKVSPDTALRDINDLIEKGILRRDAPGGRSTSYVLVERT